MGGQIWKYLSCDQIKTTTYIPITWQVRSAWCISPIHVLCNYYGNMWGFKFISDIDAFQTLSLECYWECVHLQQVMLLTWICFGLNVVLVKSDSVFKSHDNML